jgi:hypothetical protein
LSTIDLVGLLLLLLLLVPVLYIQAPRRLVTAANSLVAKRKYSEALTHYYDALDVRRRRRFIVIERRRRRNMHDPEKRRRRGRKAV